MSTFINQPKGALNIGRQGDISRPTYWLIFRYQGVESEQIGPFATAEERDTEAARYFREEMDDQDDLSALDVDADGTPHVWDYSGAFADEARAEDEEAA